MAKEREYWIEYPDGSQRGLKVDSFKKAIEKAIRNTLTTTYDYRVDQRCYQDGRWDVTIRTPYYPNRPQYRRRHKLRWDTDRDMEDFIGMITCDFWLWIVEQERQERQENGTR